MKLSDVKYGQVFTSKSFSPSVRVYSGDPYLDRDTYNVYPAAGQLVVLELKTGSLHWVESDIEVTLQPSDPAPLTLGDLKPGDKFRFAEDVSNSFDSVVCNTGEPTWEENQVTVSPGYVVVYDVTDNRVLQALATDKVVLS